MEQAGPKGEAGGLLTVMGRNLGVSAGGVGWGSPASAHWEKGAQVSGVWLC